MVPSVASTGRTHRSFSQEVPLHCRRLELAPQPRQLGALLAKLIERNCRRNSLTWRMRSLGRPNRIVRSPLHARAPAFPPNRPPIRGHRPHPGSGSKGVTVAARLLPVRGSLMFADLRRVQRVDEPPRVARDRQHHAFIGAYGDCPAFGAGRATVAHNRGRPIGKWQTSSPTSAQIAQ